MGSVYVPPAGGGPGAGGGAGGGGGGLNSDATRAIQYNYVRNYMIAHLFSWPSYRYIYLQTIIFALAFLTIGILHHFQIHDRSVLGVRWSKWSTKNRVIKLGSKESEIRRQQQQQPLLPPSSATTAPRVHLGEHGQIVAPYRLAQDNSAPPPPTQPAVIDGVHTAFSYPPSATAAARARARTLNRATIYSMSGDTDFDNDFDDHASIEGVRGDSFFTKLGRIPRWLFSPSFRRRRRAAKQQQQNARRSAAGLRRRHKRRAIEFPSFGRIITLVFVTAVPVTLSLVGADYINPNSAVFDFRSSWMSANDAYLYSIGGIARRQPIEWGRGIYPSITTNAAGVTLPYRDWWTAGNRVGDFAFALTPLAVIVALKQVPWALLSTKWLGGLAFDKLNFLHVWVGRLIWIFATAHVGAWSVQLARDQQYNQPMWNFIFWWVKFRWGIVAYVFLTLLMFLSLSPFRMDTYEWFYAAHVVCAFGFLLTSALHHPPLWPWMGAPLIWWALERAHRAYRVMRINGIGPAGRERRARAQQADGAKLLQPQGFSQYDRSAGAGASRKEAQWANGSHQPASFRNAPLSLESAHHGRAGYLTKHPSVMTSSSLLSESTYVNSSYTPMSKLYPLGEGAGASGSSSSTTPVNSPPLAGRRVVGGGGGYQGANMVDVANALTAEDMYTGKPGSYRPDLHVYPAETDLGAEGGALDTPVSDTPPTISGLHDGPNHSQVHLLAPPGSHALGAGNGGVAGGGGGGATSTTLTPQHGLSPNPSMQDFARLSPGHSPSFVSAPSMGGGGYMAAGSRMIGRNPARLAPRAALSPEVLAILKPGFAFAEVLPGQTVRLTLRTPHSLEWRPGQYVNLNVPDVAWWQSHPFTIASAYTGEDGETYGNDERTMVLIIRARQGFTLSLWEHICQLRYRQIAGAMQAGRLAQVPQKHQTGVQIRAIVDGPYGSTGRIHWGAHSTVMIICGGSGVSFGLSVLEHLCGAMVRHAEQERLGTMGEHGPGPSAAGSSKKDDRRAFLTRRIRFVWILREFVHLQWAASALRRCLALVSPEQLQVDIFVTHFNDESHYERNIGIGGVARGGAAGGEAAPVMVSAAQHGEFRAKMSSSSAGTGMGPGSHAAGDESYAFSPPGTPNFTPGPFGAAMSNTVSTSGMSTTTSTFPPTSASYATRAARFTEGPEQDDYGFEAEDLTNFDGEAADGVLSKAEMEMNRRMQKEGKLRRAHTRKMSMHAGAGAGRAGRGRGRGGGVGGASGARAGGDASAAAGYLGEAELAAFSEAHGGAPLPASEPLRAAIRPGQDQKDGRVPGPTPGPDRADDDHSRTAPATATETPIDLDEQEDEDLRVIAELARPGHPKLDKIVREECERSWGRVMISSCGPASLGTVLRAVATKQMDPARVKAGDLRYQVNVVTESFEWGGS
ncbi:hypothetical protein OC844_007241 [Tilletia horrida]|nr:hypothetical protein OC844_007241 [Tilletia horrida]